LVIDGDSAECTDDKEEDKVPMQLMAAQAIVLLKNDKNTPPLAASSMKKLAIIGENAKVNVLPGGGSACPSHLILSIHLREARQLRGQKQTSFIWKGCRVSNPAIGT
jgi:beta-glucosidase-like glycosyl hydrolase